MRCCVARGATIDENIKAHLLFGMYMASLHNFSFFKFALNVTKGRAKIIRAALHELGGEKFPHFPRLVFSLFAV